jgi:hypothetical protein
MKTAIVTTIRRYDQEAGDWIRYHRAIGFDVLYLFVDEPCPETLTIPSGVKVVACDGNWWSTFASHPLYQKLDPVRHAGTKLWLQTESLTLRQLLNAERGIEWALNDGVTWLLHIDGDELFHGNGDNVVEHFRSLEREQIHQVRYLNREAVALNDDGCPFTKLVFFRRNWDTLSGAERAQVEAQLNGKPWFLAYTNGKSAVKLAPGIKPDGAHGFCGDAAQKKRTLGSPAILHYPYSSYERFLEKHLAFGVFDPTRLLDWKWHPPPLIAAAQEYVRRGDKNGLCELYRDWVLMNDDDQRALVEAGAIVEIRSVSETLRSNSWTGLA